MNNYNEMKIRRDIIQKLKQWQVSENRKFVTSWISIPWIFRSMPKPFKLQE